MDRTDVASNAQTSGAPCLGSGESALSYKKSRPGKLYGWKLREVVGGSLYTICDEENKSEDYEFARVLIARVYFDVAKLAGGPN